MVPVLTLLALSIVAITSSSRDRTISSSPIPRRYPFGLEQDDVCGICMTRPCVSNDSNPLVRSWRTHNVSKANMCFPDCHGYQYCEPCIIRICGDSSESHGKCPKCRRSMHPSLRPIMQHILLQRSGDPKLRYHSRIKRLQREDRSMCKCLNIWSLHHPLRHCIRNGYYQCLHCVFVDDFVYRDSKGCCSEFSELTTEPRCMICDILCWTMFFVGHSATLMCCFVDCFCGTFCRDFCHCEPPMDPVVWA